MLNPLTSLEAAPCLELFLPLLDTSVVSSISVQVASINPVSAPEDESNLYLFIESKVTSIATALMKVAGSILSIIQDDVSAWHVFFLG